MYRRNPDGSYFCYDTLFCRWNPGTFYGYCSKQNIRKAFDIGLSFNGFWITLNQGSIDYLESLDDISLFNTLPVTRNEMILKLQEKFDIDIVWGVLPEYHPRLSLTTGSQTVKCLISKKQSNLVLADFDMLMRFGEGERVLDKMIDEIIDYIENNMKDQVGKVHIVDGGLYYSCL